MPSEKSRGGSLFIVDNSDSDWKVRDYLREWSDLSHQFDIATGCLEIGGLLALDEHWKKLDKIRILLGDETTLRTRKAFDQALARAAAILDHSLEAEKETNDFLEGVPAIVEALAGGRIECRMYRKDKFHAKAYITHGRHAVVGSAALVGSSNFTRPGLSQNVELNVQIQREVEELQQWYERHWEAAEPVVPELLRVIERHTREYTPFEVYAKALQEYLRRHEMTSTEWEQHESRVYPLLDQYQKEGYHALLKIARTHNGAFLCDGVGLGKTFIGMMLLERLTQFDRKRVALLVPKAARKPVWESKLNRYLPHLHGDFSNLVVYNHTDLSRSGPFLEKLARLKDMADVFIIDEAHNFRNPGIKGEGERKPSRYRLLFDMLEGKQLFMLTATPVNNHLVDLQHMIELFSRKQNDYFQKTVGIHSLPAHFRNMERVLEAKLAAAAPPGADIETNLSEAGDVLKDDILFKNIVVQRSRSYVMESQKQQGVDGALFPVREKPRVADYSVKKVYGALLEKIEEAFNKKIPLFSLAIYYPLAYYKGDDASIDPLVENRQKAVVGLIRIQFLKRFESSVTAFQMSCASLLAKLLAFVEKNSVTAGEIGRLERWRRQHTKALGLAHDLQLELFGDGSAELAGEGLGETRVLIATDVLSEGLNLQDVARLINYDLHWNPVCLMQRIGRLDRRRRGQGRKNPSATSAGHQPALRHLLPAFPAPAPARGRHARHPARAGPPPPRSRSPTRTLRAGPLSSCVEAIDLPPI